MNDLVHKISKMSKFERMKLVDELLELVVKAEKQSHFYERNLDLDDNIVDMLTKRYDRTTRQKMKETGKKLLKFKYDMGRNLEPCNFMDFDENLSEWLNRTNHYLRYLRDTNFNEDPKKFDGAKYPHNFLRVVYGLETIFMLLART